MQCNFEVNSGCEWDRIGVVKHQKPKTERLNSMQHTDAKLDSTLLVHNDAHETPCSHKFLTIIAMHNNPTKLHRMCDHDVLKMEWP